MSQKTILLVDDNENDVILAQTAFERSGIGNRVDVAQDGEEALDYLHARGKFASRDPAELPAVMLLDLNMPKVDGFEVLRRLRQNPRLQLLPVVVLTSSREARDIVRCYQLGANSYIRKPVDFEQFVATVERLGNYWLSINELAPTL